MHSNRPKLLFGSGSLVQCQQGKFRRQAHCSYPGDIGRGQQDQRWTVTTPEPEARTPYNTPLPGSAPQTPLPGAGQSRAEPAPPMQSDYTTSPRRPEEASTQIAAPAVRTSGSTITMVALGVAALSMLIGLIGFGVGVSAQLRSVDLQKQVNDLQTQQDEVNGALAALDQRTGISLGEYLEELDARIVQAETLTRGFLDRVDETARSVRFAEEYAYGVDVRLDEVVTCINRYMKTVGDSAGGRYQYFFC